MVPFKSAANITKLERFYQATSRGIYSGCLLSSHISLILSEAFLPPLRVTLSHFALLSFVRVLCLPTSFPISGLARLGVKIKLCKSFWRAFAFTHPLVLPFTFLREALLACHPFPPWTLSYFIVESIFSYPCSRSDPLVSRQGVALAYLDSLPLHDLVL